MNAHFKTVFHFFCHIETKVCFYMTCILLHSYPKMLIIIIGFKLELILKMA